MSPRVTVLMPVRNGERFVAAAIESVRRQSLTDFEFIIVDDGSTDGTLSLLHQSSRQDPRIRIIQNRGSGIVSALCEGCRAAGDSAYLARMDADDLALPRRLELQVDFLEAHPSIVAVGGQVRNINVYGTPISRARFPRSPLECDAYLAYGAPLCHPAAMIRRNSLQAVGGYREKFEPAEDLDLWLRLAKIGGLANLDEEILRFRRHDCAVTVRLAKANAMAACLARIADKYGEDLLLHCENSNLFENGWLVIEAVFPEAVRLYARAWYLQALTLNGGIVDQDAWSLLCDSAPELAKRCEGYSDRLPFTLLRASYQALFLLPLAQALLPACLGLRYMPLATCREALKSALAILKGKHASRVARLNKASSEA